MTKFKKFYATSFAGVLAASFYPLCMGARILSDMLRYGTVYAESYPKYIIPYTPIALALIVAVALMPLLLRAKRGSLLLGSGISVGVFFLCELALESQVIVTTTATTTLESWQMFMCYIPPEGYTTRTWTQVNVLMGEYSPAFKIHFYLISVLLILSLLNCLYGFGKLLKSGDLSRKKALVMQAVSSLTFLGLCILACFTAFFRTGELTVSPLSAVLMALFFIVMSVTAGVYTGSFLLEKKRLRVVLPALTAGAVSLMMYIGEMILLSSNLYRFGSGFFFDGLGALVLAPVDIIIISLSALVTALITARIFPAQKTPDIAPISQ